MSITVLVLANWVPIASRLTSSLIYLHPCGLWKLGWSVFNFYHKTKRCKRGRECQATAIQRKGNELSPKTQDEDLPFQSIPYDLCVFGYPLTETSSRNYQVMQSWI